MPPTTVATAMPPCMTQNPKSEVTRMTVFTHPTSANAMYRSVGRRVVMSAEGREFKKTMADILAKTPHGFTSGPVKLTLAFEFMTNRKRDLDNYAKPLIDTLKGVLFGDDSEIYILNMTKRIGAAVDCIRIECEPIYEDTV
jgi:Holliday junction resolvase RusA-like endonuclease